MDVHLPDGVTVQVAFEQEATFPDDVARSLLEQGEEHWRLISHYGDQPEPAQLEGATRPGVIARLMIRDLRRRRKWTQGHLAQRLAEAGYPLGQTNLSKIESGRRRLFVDDLIAICAVLNVAPSRVLEGAQLDPQPPVTVLPSLTVPLSRFRSWLRGTTPLPAPSDWRKASSQPWGNAYRSVLAPEDELAIHRRQLRDLTQAGQDIADAALEGRNHIPDPIRHRLADAIDTYNERLQTLAQAADPPVPSKKERRGRPRSSSDRRPSAHKKTSSPADPKVRRT